MFAILDIHQEEYLSRTLTLNQKNLKFNYLFLSFCNTWVTPVSGPNQPGIA
jgi:hypothetical protein